MDDGWKAVEVESETVEVNGNGANGHQDLFGVGPAIELVPVNGHKTNGNGHHDEDDGEPQQTLFSWAEFMAEPVKPKGRKTKAPSLSLFEWAVEREREEEPVGVGR